MSLLRYIISLVCLVGYHSLAFSQAYFNERYAHPSGVQSLGTSVLPTDSGYIVSGYAFYGANSQYSPLLRFLDPQGQLIREKEFRRVDYSEGFGSGPSMLALPNGGYIATGGSTYMPSGLGHAKLWRFNAQGDTIWTRTYNVGWQSYGFTCCRTQSGGFALAGEILPVSGQRKMLLICTDSAGQMLWYQQYGIRQLSVCFNMAPTSDGGFILGGTTYELNSSFLPLETYVVKTDSLGNPKWQKRFGGLVYANGAAVVRPTIDGGYALLATLGKPPIGGNNQRQPILYKLNWQGQLLWQKTLAKPTSSSSFFELYELSDGSLVGAGQEGYPTSPAGNSIPQAVVFKVCANGDSLWYRNYRILTGGNSHNYLRDLAPTPDGGFVATGFLFARAPDMGNNDAWVFKIDSAGYLQAGGPPVTVQCRQPTGLVPESLGSAIEIYPNPAPDGRFTLEAPPGATAILTDALGREVWRTSHLSPLTSNLKLPHAGLYLLRLTWPDGRTLTRKLVR